MEWPLRFQRWTTKNKVRVCTKLLGLGKEKWETTICTSEKLLLEMVEVPRGERGGL